MWFLNKKIKVAVHDGRFHADDVFSVVILSLYLKKPLKIFRTRNPKVFEQMDYLLDVGGEYNPKENKFDHHMIGWPEKRINGIPHSACSLLWKEFGEKICGSKEAALIIDNKILKMIDADDNGFSSYAGFAKENGFIPFCLGDFIEDMNPINNEGERFAYKRFIKMVRLVKIFFKVEIERALKYVNSKPIMEKILSDSVDKRIIISETNCPIDDFAGNYPEPLFIVKEKEKKGIWHVSSVKVLNEKYKNRLSLPKEWAGKSGEDLKKITGVEDALFCHNAKYMCAAGSKSSAIELAKKAINLENK